MRRLTNHVSSREGVENLQSQDRWMRTPNLNALRMFDGAARFLSFRGAAEELNLTQGAVAQQVRRLEADLGVALFDRKPRGLALTEVGRAYHIPVRRALALIEEATAKLVPDPARVTISVTPSFASKWLVPRLGAFAELHPDIDLQIVASEGLATFRSDGVDLAIRQGAKPSGETLAVEYLAPVDLRAVCSAEYASDIGPVDGISTFAAHTLLQDSHRHWALLLEAANVKPRKRLMQFNQSTLAIDAAADGQGIALAPAMLVANELAKGRVVEVWRGVANAEQAFYIVCPANTAKNPATQLVIRWIHAEADPQT